jgi:hypothetical protein
VGGFLEARGEGRFEEEGGPVAYEVLVDGEVLQAFAYFDVDDGIC